MKLFLFFILYVFLNISYSEDYIFEFQAKVKNLKEYHISKTEQFRNYDLEGTFTDNYANYGKFSAVIISFVKDNKILRLDSTGENIFSNNEKIYFRGIREKSDVDAGIAQNVIIGASEKLNSLIGTVCITSVRYFDDVIFGLNKCKLSKTFDNVLKNLND